MFITLSGVIGIATGTLSNTVTVSPSAGLVDTNPGNNVATDTDTLVLFSDGVTEAMDPDEQLFGVPRLRDVLVGKTNTDLDEIQKTVLESVENFARGARQADDLTLLLVRYRDPNSADNTDTAIPPPASSEAA